MFAGVILAGGVGVRMKSSIPKLLHNLLGKPIIKYVVDNLSQLDLDRIVIVVKSDLKEKFQKICGNDFVYVEQDTPLGSGDALKRAIPELDGFSTVLVVNGDAPLITREVLKELISYHIETSVSATVLSTILDDPMHYGRVVKDQDGNVLKIVEAKDATDREKNVKEVNTGGYCFVVEDLKLAIDKMTNNNAQGEYYITEVIEILNSIGKRVNSYITDLGSLALGINSRFDLYLATKKLLEDKIQELMTNGVTIVSPENTYIEPDVKIGKDTVIEPFSILKGNTVIGENCTIGPSSYILDAKIGDRSEIFYSVIKNSEIESDVRVGPFSHIRDGAIIKSYSAIGDFVEVKKSIIGSYTKALHHSYLGDAEIGERVNIGAGVITCNYDGKQKHKTIIEDDAFIGSNTNLIAPIRVGKGAVTGAGAVVNKDVEDNTVVVGVPARVLRKKEEGGKGE